ncbi:MAG: hypothetical protein LBD42_06440 [Desulfovibrio sp.]|nr:hypothetical protein [Desulfovibrio sp.]
MLTTIGDRTIPLQGGMEMTGGEGKAAFVLAHGQTLGYCFYRNTSMDCELAGGRSRQGLYLLRQSGAALYRSMRERGGLPSPERNEQWSTIWREHSLYGPERLGLYSDLEENTRVEIHLTEIYLP